MRHSPHILKESQPLTDKIRRGERDNDNMKQRASVNLTKKAQNREKRKEEGVENKKLLK